MQDIRFTNPYEWEKLDEDLNSSLSQFHPHLWWGCFWCGFGCVSGVACVRCFSFWCDFSLFSVLSRVPIGIRLVCSFLLCIQLCSGDCFLWLRLFIYTRSSTRAAARVINIFAKFWNAIQSITFFWREYNPSIIQLNNWEWKNYKSQEYFITSTLDIYTFWKISLYTTFVVVLMQSPLSSFTLHIWNHACRLVLTIFYSKQSNILSKTAKSKLSVIYRLLSQK